VNKDVDFGHNFGRKHLELTRFWLQISKIFFKKFSEAQGTFYCLNLAREQKSLATPVIYRHFIKKGPQVL
jgi:hypothetical protein